TVPALRAAAADPDPRIRRAAIGALGSMRTDTQEAIAHGLTDEEWSVRESAAEALGRGQADAATIAALTDALDDPYWQVRLKAIRSLGQLGITEAALTIARSLTHPEANLRKEAAAALGQIAHPDTRDALERAAL